MDATHRGLWPCYAAAFFSLGHIQMAALLMPLWTVSLGATAAAIGLILGMRSLLPTLLAIHAGSVMDMLGARRVLLPLAVVQVVLSLLFPLFPTLWALVVLQLVAGLVQSIAWVGAQTQIAQAARMDPGAAGRFSFAANIGAFIGPLAVGVAWDMGGGWGGFGLMAAWSLGLLAAVLAAPETPVMRKAPVRVRDVVVPNLADYMATVRLLIRPAVAVMALATFIRIACVGVQGSFYPVLLESRGLSGTIIGILIGAASLSAGGGSLLAGWTARRFGASGTLVLSIGLAVVALALTPLLPNVPTLLVFAIVTGGGIGLSLAAVITLTASAVGPSAQGRGVGLRSTTNNLSWLLIPVVMGATVEATSLVDAFYWVGAGLVVLTLVLYGMTRIGVTRARSTAE